MRCILAIESLYISSQQADNSLFYWNHPFLDRKLTRLTVLPTNPASMHRKSNSLSTAGNSPIT